MEHPDQLELTDALVQAIEQDRFRLAESLLKKGASPNLILPSSGISPFHLAIGADTSNTLDFVKLLLEHNGNPNIRSEDGMTPVHVAATWGRYQALGLLLRNGGNPDLCDEEGATAIDLANEHGNTECYNIMMTYKSDEEQNEQSWEDDKVFTKYRKSGSSCQSFQDPCCDHSWQFSNSPLDCPQDSIHVHPSLDSTGLSDYLQESCISCSSYSAPPTDQDKEYLPGSFFPDLVPSIGAEADNYFDPSKGDCCHPILKTARREYFQKANFRPSFGVTGTRNKSSGTNSLSDVEQISRERDSEKIETKLREHSQSTNNKASLEVGEKKKQREARRTLSEPKQVLVGQSESHSEVLETKQRENSTRTNFRSNLNVGGRIVPSASRRIFSEPNSVFKESDRCSEAFKDCGNSPVSMMQDGDDETEEPSCDRTLSSKELEEALSESCHGLDLTSPDHPTVFTKFCSCQSGETPTLDKTVIYLPPRRSTAMFDSCLPEQPSTEVSPESRVSNTSDESSAYVTCQSDDMFSCNSKKHIPDKQKRNSRRVTFSDYSESFIKVPKTTHHNEATGMDERCSNQDEMQGLLPQTSQRDQRKSFEEASSSLEDSLITSDEDSLLPLSREQYENSCKQGNQANDDCVTPARRSVAHKCQSSEDPQSLTSQRPGCGKVSEKEDIEILYHDPQTGASLVERQCPSAMSTHQDLSVLEYSMVSSDDTMLYDWRDYQTEDDDPLESPSLSQELLELTDNGIREMMRKYGEEAGPITSTTRLVYLRHLAKLQEDPSFAKRAASRHNTEGFRWELAEYLNTGHLKESDHTMVAEEQLMVAPFQIPDQSRKWREGTLKSSFNYLLLDPRVTMDLPGRYTQLTELETFRVLVSLSMGYTCRVKEKNSFVYDIENRQCFYNWRTLAKTLQVFVAATFYIGKGKRGRPYAHFYEALSSMKPPKDKEADKSVKAAKKQPGAKVNHILDIWSAGLGVVSLHCFQSVIPVEAYAREACMVEAVGLSRLTNIKKGDFYGPSSTWPVRQRRQMGVFLLKKACQIFLIEGERQIRPVDIALGTIYPLVLYTTVKRGRPRSVKTSGSLSLKSSVSTDRHAHTHIPTL